MGCESNCPMLCNWHGLAKDQGSPEVAQQDPPHSHIEMATNGPMAKIFDGPILALIIIYFVKICSPNLVLLSQSCSQLDGLWRPHLHKDIVILERVQIKATKFILK